MMLDVTTILDRILTGLLAMSIWEFFLGYMINGMAHHSLVAHNDCMYLCFVILNNQGKLK